VVIRPLAETSCDLLRMRPRRFACDDRAVTLVWFIVWLIANNIGDSEPLLFDPVNWWAGALILAAALDLSRQHIRPAREH
jgi:hypothetical protein